MAKDERRKKNRLSSSNGDGIDYDVASVVVRGRPHRCATTPPRRAPPSSPLSSFSARQPGSRLALTVASSVGRLVCRMNECSWCQPRPITRYTTLTQCLLLLLLQWRRRRGARASLPLAAAGKRRRGAAANDTALSFFHMCLFTPASVGPLTERVAAS